MPTTKDVTTIPDLWDTLFASDSLTIVVKHDQIQPIKLALGKYKAKQMKKLKGQIEQLVISYTTIRTPETPHDMCSLRIDLKRQGSKIEHMGITINDSDLEDM